MIPDNEFITSKDVPGPTKEEIRCLVLCKAEVSPDDVVVDIGCGTGGLTLEFAKRVRKVYAIDKDINAVNLTLENLKRHGLEHKVSIIKNDALSALKEIDKFDVLMIGGSGGDLPLIIEEGYRKLGESGRILITSILLETPVEAIKTMKKLEMKIELINVAVFRGKILERGTMMYSNNPITIISARNRSK
ncbi:MAG: precorrin-6Y C5,15-methyltransferase (decarboxylating) subunit CbiT [Methanobacterium sp.]|jgi:cobalt-precorrin-6B (C15)-methyltransferase